MMNGERSLLSNRVSRVTKIFNDFLQDDKYTFAPASENAASVQDVYLDDTGTYIVYLEGVNYDSKWVTKYKDDVKRALGKRYAFEVKDGIPVIQFTPPTKLVMWSYVAFFLLWLCGLCAWIVLLLPRVSALASYMDTHDTPGENLRRALMCLVTGFLGVK